MVTGLISKPYIQSFGGWQNCMATPNISGVEFLFLCVFWMLQILKTEAYPSILPPDSRIPEVGGIDNSNFNRLPCLNTLVGV